MTRTEERLADALDAAARGLREDTLRPLVMPERRPQRRAWLAPLAAAAALLVVVGLGVVVARQTPRSGHGGGQLSGVPVAPHSYYVQDDLDQDRPVVRSTATGAVTATVPVPRAPHAPGYNMIASANNGTFFVIAFVPGVKGQQRLYRFQVAGSGQVKGFSAVPGGLLGRANWEADAIAASPDGSRVAVSFSYLGPPKGCGQGGLPKCPPLTAYRDYIDVVNTATGAKTVWRSRMSKLGPSFGVSSLSWTADGRELVVLGTWCKNGGVGESCGGRKQRTAEVWAVFPANSDGLLEQGELLLRESTRYPFIAQAVICSDGSFLTAVVLRGPVVGTTQISGSVPDNLSVEQISVLSGQRLSVLYRRHLGPTDEVNGVPDFLALYPDASGQNWMLNGGICSGHCTGGFNGWIHNGRLVALQPTDGRMADEAW
jgi:hypothetical protein